jgi:hypothetical protein
VLVGAVVFAVFCIPASGVAFSILGIGGRTVEFHLKDDQYQRLFQLGGIQPQSGTPNEYQCYLRLRLGSELVFSASEDNEGGRPGIVVIPRDAIRGLRFVPLTPKSDEHAKIVQKSVPVAKSAQPTPKKSP